MTWRTARPAVRRAVLASTLAALTIAALAACAAAAPPQLSFAVFQNRDDYAARKAVIEIANNSPHDVEITAADFESTWYPAPASATLLPYDLGAGRTIEFPIAMSDANCDASTAQHTVTVSYREASGTTGTLSAAPTLPFDSLPRLYSQDCGKASFEKVATINPASALRIVQDDGIRVAQLDLTFTPTGQPGSVTLVSTQSTTLLSQREGDIRPFNLTFTASSAPLTITLNLVPSRCGTHVIGEDKIGTLIPIHAITPAFPDAYFSVAVSPDVKKQFYDFVSGYCPG
jgi:hypothetical protein